MANFPLSHITVGGNTYDITHATLLTCTIAQADFSGGAYLADAWFKGANDDLTVQSYSGKTLTDAYDDLVAGHPVYLAIEVNSSITDIIPLSVDSGGWQKIFYGVVSTTGHIYSFKVFDAAMMDDFPTKISKVADSASGGGGGGSSTTILGLYDPNTGHLMNLGSVSQSMTVEVWDITDINNPVALDDSDMLTKIQAGPCYFKDSRFNTYSVVYDASANKIGVIYNAADMPYYMSIGFQWATNWTIAVNKYFALQ